MKTTKEVERETGVSRRQIEYWDSKGLIQHTGDNPYLGYQYDDNTIGRIRMIKILSVLDLESSGKKSNKKLDKIKEILDGPVSEQQRYLEKAVLALKNKRQEIDNLITYATVTRCVSVETMSQLVGSEEPMEVAGFIQGLWDISIVDLLPKKNRRWEYLTDEDLSEMKAKVQEMTRRIGDYRENGGSDKELKMCGYEIWRFIDKYLIKASEFDLLYFVIPFIKNNKSVSQIIDGLGGAGCIEYIIELLRNAVEKAACLISDWTKDRITDYIEEGFAANISGFTKMDEREQLDAVIAELRNYQADYIQEIFENIDNQLRIFSRIINMEFVAEMTAFRFEDLIKLIPRRSLESIGLLRIISADQANELFKSVSNAVRYYCNCKYNDEYLLDAPL